jgi:hypothetical protein
VGALALVEDDRFEASGEVSAPDPGRDNGSRVAFDRTWDLRVLGRPRNTMPALPWQTAEAKDWRTRPIEIRLALEQISFD